MTLAVSVVAACGGDNSRQPGFPDGDRLPLIHELRDDGVYVQAESGAWMPVEFGGWGSHLDPHTGHGEGDPKNNWSILIKPPADLIELVGHARNVNGNQDGVCDSGELCGVTADVAKMNDVWYVNPFDELDVLSVTVEEARAEYLDEPYKWNVEVYLPGRDAGHRYDHVGELSPELIALVQERAGSAIFDDPLSVRGLYFSEDPLHLPGGARIGRGQRIIFSEMQVDSQMVYDIVVQIEWFTLAGLDFDQCTFATYPQSEREGLQRAMDAHMTAPFPGARWDYDFEGQVSIFAGAQGRICNSDVLDIIPNDTLSSFDSRAWTNTSDPREVLAIVPIHKDTVGYQQIKDSLHARGGDFLFRWASHSREEITQDLGLTFVLGDYQGEVLDLVDPTASTGSFILWIDRRSGDFDTLAVGVTYSLEPDRLVLRFGDATMDLASVVLPEPVQPGTVCDGARVRCYSRDWKGLNYGQ